MQIILQLLLLHCILFFDANATVSTDDGDEAADRRQVSDPGAEHRLNYYPASIHHTFSCADGGVWKGSCDINHTMPSADTNVLPTIFSPADWSPQCDPWKAVTELQTLTYNPSSGVWVNATGETITDWTNPRTNWTCPPEHRSVSGCGDFRTDPRSVTCEARINLLDCGRPLNADRRIMNMGEESLAGPQRHVCIQHPIFYDNLNTADAIIPPSLGRHRERWAKWGEYDFLPPQRWMHNNEHGGMIFLYNPCLDGESLCALRRYIQKWQVRIGTIPAAGSAPGDAFRFILTPFKNLATPMAIVTWGHMYSGKCFNERDMDYFIQKWYRNGFEDWPPNGAYDYLWRNLSETAASCPVAVPRPAPHQNYMLTVMEMPNLTPPNYMLNYMLTAMEVPNLTPSPGTAIAPSWLSPFLLVGLIFWRL